MDRIADSKRIAIIAALAANEGDTQRAADVVGVSRRTVQRVKASLEGDGETALMVAVKREALIAEMDRFLRAELSVAQSFVRRALRAMDDDAKIDKASIVQLATAIGIVIDKWSGVRKMGADDPQGISGAAGGVVEIPSALPDSADAVHSGTDAARDSVDDAEVDGA